ncbi:MAG: methyltransferase domain-containing protein, partial [Candidatus Binatota bacterium]
MKRSREKEMMDLPGNPAGLLEEDLTNLRLLNRTLGGYRGVLWNLDRLINEKENARFTLLDVGTGSGDIPRAIVRWARARGISVNIVALEPDPVTAGVARRLTKDLPEISIVRGDARHLPFASASFDFVLASQFL